MARQFLVFTLLSVCLVLTVDGAHALWVYNGVPICTAVDYQDAVTLVSDGQGGAILMWQDARPEFDPEEQHLYARRVDGLGNPQWAADGVPICTEAKWKLFARAVSDGAGGAIFAWLDGRNAADLFVFAQRVDATGAPQWATDGIPICGVPTNFAPIAMAADGYGGAIIAWSDTRSGPSVYAQRVDASGSTLWTFNGQVVCASTATLSSIAVAATGAGGAIIAWPDTRTSGGIYAQHVNAAGSPTWAVNGVQVSFLSSGVSQVTSASDDQGRAILAWVHSGSGNENIGTQMVDSLGGLYWGFPPPDGLAVCSASGNQTSVVVASDGPNGAVYAWQDARSDAGDIYAQRVDVLGAVQWQTDGIPLCTATGTQNAPRIAADAGISIVAWRDSRVGTPQVYAQSVNAAGAVLGGNNGAPVSQAPTATAGGIVADGIGGAIVAMTDDRGVDRDIYAQRVTGNVDWGVPEPHLMSVQDTPNDEGGWLRMHIEKSDLDTALEPIHPITGYNVWRDITNAAMMLNHEAEVGREITADGGVAVGKRVSGAEALALGLPPGTWESLGFHAATQDSFYDLAVATHNDSTSNGTAWETLVVTAHTPTPSVFYTSDVDSGYSVDNLAPAALLNFTGIQSVTPVGLDLSWQAAPEPDLSHYVLHRSTTPGFIPDIGNLLVQTTQTTLFDDAWRWDSGYYYKVAAVDRHEGTGAYIELGPGLVVGVDEALPQVTSVGPNYPNPFNPVTSIAVALHEPGHVTMRVYDARGSLVRTVVDRPYAAGRFVLQWEGRDDAGKAVASGVYFYRIETASGAFTRKMLLLK